jgi:hypothetical protein
VSALNSIQDYLAKERFLDLLRKRFNSGVRYRRRVLKWDTVIKHKAVELAGLLVGRSERLGFSNPFSGLARTDDRELRIRILNLTQQEARRAAAKPILPKILD